MNGFLWLGVASTAVLLLGLILDSSDGVMDSLHLEFAGDWLSLPVIAAFLGAFGFSTGALIDGLGPIAILIGVVVGIVFGFGAYRLSRALHDMPTDATETEAGLLASLGRVVVAPAPGRLGEVLLHRPTGPVKVACASDEAIAAGTTVVVVDVRSSTLVVVEKFDDGVS